MKEAFFLRNFARILQEICAMYQFCKKMRFVIHVTFGNFVICLFLDYFLAMFLKSQSSDIDVIAYSKDVFLRKFSKPKIGLFCQFWPNFGFLSQITAIQF